MRAAAFTPGPWRYGPLSQSVIAADGRLVADLAERDPERENVAADGRLIAVTPSLINTLSATEAQLSSLLKRLDDKALPAIARASVTVALNRVTAALDLAGVSR